MNRRKTVALSSTLVLVTTVTAVALNIGVMRITRSEPDASAAPAGETDEAEVTTVVIDVPPEETTTTVAAQPAILVESTGVATPGTAEPPAPVQAPAPPEPESDTTRRSSADPPSTTAPPTPTTTVTPTTTEAPVATEYLSFAAGAAGEVVIANHGDILEFWAAYPPEGWEYQIENPIGRQVTVKYRIAGGGEARFTAKLEGGEVRIEAEGLGGGGDDD